MDSKHFDLSQITKPFEVARKAVHSVRGQADYIFPGKAISLRDGLIAHANGFEYDNTLYSGFRRSLMDRAELTSVTPSFVLNCSDFSQFSNFIQSAFSTYREPRIYSVPRSSRKVRLLGKVHGRARRYAGKAAEMNAEVVEVDPADVNHRNPSGIRIDPATLKVVHK